MAGKILALTETGVEDQKLKDRNMVAPKTKKQSKSKERMIKQEQSVQKLPKKSLPALPPSEPAPKVDKTDKNNGNNMKQLEFKIGKKFEHKPK